MIAHILYPTFTRTITILACFIQKNVCFATSPRHHPDPLGILQLPPDLKLELFLFLTKTDTPISFPYYPQNQ